MTRNTALSVVCLVSGVLVLYGTGLTHTPPYLHEAEVLFGLHAHAIATTGHDMEGRLLPLYFQMRPIGENVWFHPAIVYLTAPFLLFLPFTEWVLRLPSVLVATVNVVLLYGIARRLFGRERLALLAAVLLALTPAHFVNSRIAMDYVYPLPCMLGWVLCLLIYLDRRQMWLLFAGGSLLGLGVYTYIASVVMMPFYLLLTWLTVYVTHDKPRRPAMVAAAGFTWPLLILPIWLYYHPEVFAETLNRYGGEQAELLLNVRGKPLAVILEELRRPLRFSGVTGRASLYWYFFDPSFLFLSGGYASVVNSTRHVGVFLLPLLVLVPLGVWRVAAGADAAVKRLLLVGFFSAPLAATLVVPEPYAIDREMQIVPFGVLLATYGVAWLFAERRAWPRRLGVGLIALGALHFGYFFVDYYTDYRGRSAYWFNKNHRGALETILALDASQPAPAIYLTRTKDPYIAAYWRLALIKHDKLGLLARTMYFDGGETLDVATMPAGSLLLTISGDTHLASLVEAGTLGRSVEIPEPADPPHFAVLRR